MYMQHKTQGKPSGIKNITLLINLERLFTDLTSCDTMFQIFNARYFKDFKQGFFQALCHNTVFVFQIGFAKGRRPFLMFDMRIFSFSHVSEKISRSRGL